MSTTRIKIDIISGIIEAEGNEEFVRSIYNDFKEKISKVNFILPKEELIKPPAKDNKKLSNSNVGIKVKSKKRTSLKTHSIVKDLNLAGNGEVPRLRDFYSEYNPKSFPEKNLIFVYYLQHKLSISNITLNHMYTCYRDITSLKVPNALKQSLFDTRKKGWIDTTSTADIKCTIHGMNHIEKDMLKSEINNER